jgi:hypothetical protein
MDKEYFLFYKSKLGLSFQSELLCSALITVLNSAALHRMASCCAAQRITRQYSACNALQRCVAVHSTSVHSSALRCAALHSLPCTALPCTALHSASLHHTALHSAFLHHKALHCMYCFAAICRNAQHFIPLTGTVLRCAALRCAALRCAALHQGITLHRIALLRCDAMQSTSLFGIVLRWHCAVLRIVSLLQRYVKYSIHYTISCAVLH